MEIFGVLAVLSGIVSLVMLFVVKAEPTEKKVIIPGGICVVSLILFIVLYLI